METKVSLIESKNLEEDVEKSLDLIDYELEKGSYLIKPNLLKPMEADTGVTTDSRVVEAIVKHLKKKGITDISIGDNSGGGNTEETFEKCGYKELSDKHNVKLVNFNEDSPLKLKVGGTLEEVSIAKTVRDADHIINVPKLKSHSLALFSFSLKNLLGCITPKESIKKYMHEDIYDVYSLSGSQLLEIYNKFCEKLAELNKMIPVDLIVFDGIWGHEGDGPSHGEPKKMGIMMSGTDPVACDTIATQLVGYNPSINKALGKAAGKRVGMKDMSKINLRGKSIKEVKRKFKLPENWKGILNL